MVDMVAAALENDYAKARKIHAEYFPLFANMLSLEPNPVSIKYAMNLAGKIASPEVRLPLTMPSAANEETLKQLLKAVVV